MSNTNQDDVSSRFRAIWVGLLALLSFGILTSFVVCKTAKDPAAVDPVTIERAKVRAEKLAEVRAAQEPLVDAAAFVDEAAGIVRLPATAAADLVLPSLQAKKPAATQAVVPGSPTQIEQSAAPAPGAAEEAKPAAEEKAAPEKAAAEKPAAAKPAAAKPAAEPAAKPAVPAPTQPAPAPESAPAKPAAK